MEQEKPGNSNPTYMIRTVSRFLTVCLDLSPSQPLLCIFFKTRILCVHATVSGFKRFKTSHTVDNIKNAFLRLLCFGVSPCSNECKIARFFFLTDADDCDCKRSPIMFDSKCNMINGSVSGSRFHPVTLTSTN